MRAHALIVALAPFAAAFVLAGCQEQPTAPQTPALEAGAPSFGASASKTEISGYVFNCGVLEEGETRITPGGVLHARGGEDWIIWDVGNALVDGPGILDGSGGGLNFNFNNFIITSHGKGVIYPDAVNGTWELVANIKVNPNESGVAITSGRGTGELHGMTLKYEARPIEDGPAAPCPDAFVFEVTGVIVEPASR